jgi:hypothetical protein
MKKLVALVALLGFAAVPALAANGGISGTLVDEAGRPVAGAPVAIFRMPIRQADTAMATVKTNGRGFFAEIALPPGRYVVSSVASTQSSSCVVDDVFDGAVTRVKLRLGPSSKCSGPRLHSAVVNPALTSDVYVVH